MMIGLYFKQLQWSILFIITFSVQKCMLLTVCPTAIWLPNTTVVAGAKSGNPGSNSTMLNKPTDVYVDNNNTIYVLDAGNYRVQRFFPNSTIGTTVLSSANGTDLNQFSSMDSMSIDANGSIYIADGGIGRVTKWMVGAQTGIVVAGGNGIGSDINQMNGVGGMYIHPSTMAIWIADIYNNRITKWSSPTTPMVVCGSYGSGNDQFIHPSGLFVDSSSSDTLYVADSGNHRIQMWVTGARSGQTVAGITSYYGGGLNQLWWPSTLIVDTNGNMFILDDGNNRILRWMVGSSSGVIIAGRSISDPQLAELYGPISITFDSNGAIFFIEPYNNQVRKISVSCPNISNTTPSSITKATPTSNITCSTTMWSPNATTVAGSPIGLAGNSSALLSYPSDVFVGNNNTLYVLDTNNYRVQRFLSNSTNGTTIISGDYGAALDQFGSMAALSIDINNNIYILDAYNARVTKWTPGYTTGTIAAGGNGQGNSVIQLNYPYGMFVEYDTAIIWIADTYNSRIVRWDSPSIAVVVCGSIGVGSKQFYYPSGLFVDTSASNTLYVADSFNNRIQMWVPGAINGTTVAGVTGVHGNGLNQLWYPTTLIVDANGYMYIVDAGNNRILQWMVGSSFGVILVGTSTYGVLPNQLYYPSNIKLDSSGALLIVDYYNSRIQKFSVSCEITTTLHLNTSTVSTSSIILFASFGCYPRWFLMIIYSFIILINN